MTSPLDKLDLLRDGRTKRISSYDRSGGNHDSVRIEPGETVTIAKIDGPGRIRHIWFTVSHEDAMHRRNMVMRMYWDGQKKPSVECPLGDFFGQGWGENYNYAALPMAASPAKGRGMNCYFPMPFSDGAEITIENDSDGMCRAFYYYIDYEECDTAPADSGRFHAFWNRSYEAPALDTEARWTDFSKQSVSNLTDEYNHLIIDAKGRGHYVGVNYFVECPSPAWYGEGDDMFFIDGEPWPPSLHGTGTEDYFNCSWCPKEYYTHPYFGYPRVTDESGHLGRTHCYRYHIEDPIMFQKSLRGSIERGHANNMALDIVTVGYWYQTLPHKPFPKLPNRAGRQNMPRVHVNEMHKWREAWRQIQGGGNLWGNEPFKEPFAKKISMKLAKGRAKLLGAAAESASKKAQRAQRAMLSRKRKKK
jgi:hypothetical protein